MERLYGICAAMCTPFTEDGEGIDEKAFKKQIDILIDAGTHIILVCGGTGEFAYLRPEEKRYMAETAARHIGGRCKLMVQTSAIGTRDAVENAKFAEGAGADALLILPPYFEGPDARGVYYHYEKIAEAIQVPIVAYNIPVHSGFDITPEFFTRLREIGNVQYIKDSTGDLVRIRQLIASGAQVFNGGDPIAFDGLMSGAVGCVWGACNAMPKEAVELYNLVAGGDLSAAHRLWQRLLPLNLFFWTHVYNASVKAATNLRINPVGPCRKPVMPLTGAEEKELKKALAALDE
jgi:4-hydroxy-tetrahydrodipicolinate synthase